MHRSCLHDDAFGVGEALIEEAFNRGLVVRGSHYVVIGNANGKNPDGTNNSLIISFNCILPIYVVGRTTAAQEKDLAHQKLISAWTFISPTKGLTFDQYKAKYKMEVCLKQPICVLETYVLLYTFIYFVVCWAET